MSAGVAMRFDVHTEHGISTLGLTGVPLYPQDQLSSKITFSLEFILIFITTFLSYNSTCTANKSHEHLKCSTNITNWVVPFSFIDTAPFGSVQLI